MVRSFIEVPGCSISMNVGVDTGGVEPPMEAAGVLKTGATLIRCWHYEAALYAHCASMAVLNH